MLDRLKLLGQARSIIKFMKILIAGGTGFIGSHIINELLKDPQLQIFCMTRDPARKSLSDKRVSLIAGDVRDTGSIYQATANMDVVILTVQFPNHPVENPRKGYTYIEIDGRGTENMIGAAVRNRVKRFIYLSGAGAGQNRKEAWFQAKDMAERAVRESGLDYVILRPSWIYGPDDRSLNRFITFIKYSPLVPVIGTGQNRVQPISVFDVAKVTTQAVFNEAATNRTFELGSKEVLTMDEILQIVMQVMKKRRLLIHFPKELMKLMAAPLTLLPEPPFSPSAIDFISTEVLIDPTETETLFNIKFESLREGLQRYIRQT
jgi:uncharacterized protein YbjT (DUF2867 family)